MIGSRGGAALLTLVLLTLAGCGGSKTAPDVRLALVQGVKGDEFYTTMACGAQDEARRLGVTLEVAGADQWNVEQQRSVLEGVMTKKPDGVLVAPVDAAAMIRPLKQLQKVGSKVVLELILKR